MFSTLDPTHHGVKRKRVSNVLSKSYLRNSADLEAITREILFQRFLPRLAKAGETGKDTDIMKVLLATNMDIATAYTWGLGNGTKYLIDEESHDEFLEMYAKGRPPQMFFAPTELSTLTSWMGKFGMSPLPSDNFYFNDTTDAWLMRLCDNAEATIASGKSADPGYNPTVYRQLKESVAKENLSPVPSMTTYRTSPLGFKRHCKVSPDTEKVITKLRSPQQVEIATELMDEIVATNDVLGNTLIYVCWELSRHPEVQKRLRDELLTLQPVATDGPQSRMHPNAKDLEQLPFLHAVIMETMRLWPTNPGLEPRITPPNTSLAGYHGIPAGVRVGAAPYSLHRNPEVFPEPESWRPERWMPESKDQGKWAGNGQAERWFWGFSSGLRMCIGNNLSLHSKKSSPMVTLWRSTS